MNDSPVGKQAQTDILFRNHLVPYIGSSKSFVTIPKVFGKKQLRKRLKEIEPIKPVKEPRFDLNGGNTFAWSPPGPDQYLGASSGGVFEPSTKLKKAAWNTPDLVTLFLLFFPIPFCNEICE